MRGSWISLWDNNVVSDRMRTEKGWHEQSEQTSMQCFVSKQETLWLLVWFQPWSWLWDNAISFSNAAPAEHGSYILLLLLDRRQSPTRISVAIAPILYYLVMNTNWISGSQKRSFQLKPCLCSIALLRYQTNHVRDIVKKRERLMSSLEQLRCVCPGSLQSVVFGTTMVVG